MPVVSLYLVLVLSAVLGSEERKGRVVDAVSRSPVADALVAAGGVDRVTGEDGSFALELPEGNWTVTIVASGYLTQSVDVEVTESSSPPLEIQLFRQGRFVEAVEVRAEAPRSGELEAVEVEPERVLRVAGSIDNVFRTVQTLPGVTATEDFGSRLSVRGGSPDQNLTVMDGVEVHNPYRLFGITSAFNPETIESFELTAGGFGARYGDRLSSLLVIENRAGNGEKKLSGSTSLSFTDANVILEGGLPGGHRGSWLVTGRRTYYDLVAERIVSDDLPSFGDLQAKVNVGVGARGTLSLFGLTSRESTDLTIEPEDDPAEFGTLVNEAGNDLVSVAFDTVFGERVTSRTAFSWYRNRDVLDFEGTFRTDTKRSNAPGDEARGVTEVVFDRLLTVEDWSLRQDSTILASESHFLDAGFELHRLETGVRFETSGDRNSQEANGSSVRGGAGLPDFIDSTLPANRLGAWVQDQVVLSKSLSIVPGLRVDWSQANGRATLSPRFTAAFQLDSMTRLRGALGRYTQSPGYEKLIQSDYFIDLTDARALDLFHESSNHFIAGVERELSDSVTARVEGFYKTFDDNIVGRLETNEERLARVSRYDFPPELQDSVPTSPLITSSPSNDAAGSAYGLDVYLAREVRTQDAKLAGWVAYTWSRAERDAYGRRYAFDYDRRHSLSLVGSYRLTAKWTLALTARLATGFPYTSPLGVRVAATSNPEDPERLIPETDGDGRLVYVANLGDTGNLNNGRLPHYARFDVRATWRPGGASGRFELYFDVINALNRDNAIRLESELEYDPEGDVPRTVERPTEGFPILPSVGVRYRF